MWCNKPSQRKLCINLKGSIAATRLTDLTMKNGLWKAIRHGLIGRIHPQIMVNKGNHPQMALIQVSEILQITQTHSYLHIFAQVRSVICIDMCVCPKCRIAMNTSYGFLH